MEDITTLRGKYRWELLLKEMGYIQDTVKNLDDIIYKTKNFSFLIWGGSLGLIVQYMDKEMKPPLILLTALIPLLFWVMDYQWRKHLMKCSRRERYISNFLNSDLFERLVLKGEKDIDGKGFPFFDVVGWIYTKSAYSNTDGPFLKEFLIDTEEFRGWNVIKYKDGKWFYGTMILVSFLFGVIHLLISTKHQS